MISIILASRERPEQLAGLIKSIESTSADLSKIEMLVGYDLDDTTARPERPWITYYGRERAGNMARDYHNWLLPEAKGDVFFVLNDDVEIETFGWDRIIRDEMRPNEPQYGQTQPMGSVHCREPYSEFPLLTRAAVEQQDYLMPPDIPGWGADHRLWKLCESRGWVVKMHDIRLRHLRQQDATHESMRRMSGSYNPNVPVPPTPLRMKKLLAVYNICGVSGRENTSLYCNSLDALLRQEPRVAWDICISGCVTEKPHQACLERDYGSHAHFSWVNEVLPLNVTFNHACRECDRRFGPYDAFLYLDSGVNVGNNPEVVYNMLQALERGPYAMMAQRVDADHGFNIWDTYRLFENETRQVLPIPVGRTVNLHCQVFSRDLFDAYGQRILPDIFAHDTSESIYTFMCAAIKRKFGLLWQGAIHHEISTSSGSAGFRRGPLLFRAPMASMNEIYAAGKEYGFGYEEIKPHWLHDPEKFDRDGFARDERLKEFIARNCFLARERFDYTGIMGRFEPRA